MVGGWEFIDTLIYVENLVLQIATKCLVVHAEFHISLHAPFAFCETLEAKKKSRLSV